MDAIKRYDPEITCEGLEDDYATMMNSPEGGYVRFVDHVARITSIEARLAAAEKERDTFKAECASISEEFGLPPTMRPVEGEIRRMREAAKAWWSHERGSK